MNHHETRAASLLDLATSDLTPDVDRLVAGGISRGRAQRRRRRVGTTLVAVAVIGVTGTAASVAAGSGLLDGSRGATVEAPVATAPPHRPAPKSSAPASPVPPQTTASSTPSGPFVADHVTVHPEDVPATVEQLLDRQGAGEVRLDPPYGTAYSETRLVTHFSWQGTLASVVIEPFSGDVQQACQQGAAATGGTCTIEAAGYPRLLWGPTTGDGVESQGAAVWRDGFEVSLQSYNAAEGKSSPPLFAHPPLTMDDLSLLAASDVWFG